MGHSSYFSSRKAFTLIELLVVIAVIAILAVVVVVILNPAQLLKQSRDANRLSDAATLKNILGIYAEDIGGSMGSSSVVYISIPDPSATSSAGDQCQGLGLPAAASDTYQCASSSAYRLTNGTGWIPLNFKSISFGTPISSLPIDPVNTSSSGDFYTYETNGTLYETTMALESSKDALTEASDGGQYTDLYEQGTSLTLSPIDFYSVITTPSPVVAYVTSGTTWSAVTNGAPITVEAIGGGGGGGSVQGGGGGGEYCKSVVAYTSGTVIPISIGQGSIGNGNGGATTWNTSVVVANGGIEGFTGGGGQGLGGSGGTGTTCYNGGAGGNNGNFGGHGGGGAAGPLGVGGAGGVGFWGGGGGGGNGAGNAGGGGGNPNGAAGGTNHGGSGSGSGDSGSGPGPGTNGGGGGGSAQGSSYSGGNGGAGTEWSTAPAYGSGGGGGGNGLSAPGAGNGGLYGGGGGGESYYGGTPGNGANGILVITYVP